MGQKQSRTQKVAITNVSNLARNVCGTLETKFVVLEPMNDPMNRDFCFYHIFNTAQSAENLEFLAIIPRPETSRHKFKPTMDAFDEVLSNINGRSKHIPRLVMVGVIEKGLIFGSGDLQEFEKGSALLKVPPRPIAIISIPSNGVLVTALLSLSKTGGVPTGLALSVGLGMVRALATLHRCGFILRYVTPFSFLLKTPFSIKSLENNVVILDLGMAQVWPEPYKHRVPFVGSLKYSSLNAILRNQVGPADDIISVIYVVAELINGRLPWRAVKSRTQTVKAKKRFSDSLEYRRLPTELRQLLHDLTEKGSDLINHSQIVELFVQAITRNNSARRKENQLPSWLEVPCHDEE